MVFQDLANGAISCIDYCDLKGDDVLIGYLQKYEDGYYRAVITYDLLMCCHLKQLASKLSELNKQID